MRYISASYDLEMATRLIGDGPNVIKGNAFLRQRGGGVVTCAGQVVNLIPGTAYANERIQAIYGYFTESTSGRGIQPIISPDPPEYVRTTRTTKCDSQGNFVFDRVADGEFFVQVRVTWETANSFQGAALVHRVAVKNNQAASLIMSD